jgi:hypothetical protein
MKSLLLLLVVLWAIPAAADVASRLVIDKPFVRSALQHQRNAAVYMQLTNNGPTAAMVGATSAAAEVVELHTHINDRGVMRMRQIPRIDLPSGEKVELRPGGLHVMLIGLRRDLNVGEDVAVTLEFSDDSKQALTVPVVRVMPQGKY